MGTIKFRGKRIDNGEWVCGNLFVPNRLVSGVFICHETNISDFFPLHEQGKPLDFDETGITLGLFYEVHPESIGQFTGLLDKNGKEVFEGDVLASEDSKYCYQVKYENGAFYYYHLSIKDWRGEPIIWGLMSRAIELNFDMVVTGNIHETNPA